VTILSPFRADQASLPTAPEPIPDSTSVALPTVVSGQLADVVERLYSEYGCCLPRSAVTRVFDGCVSDIQATPTEALPELTERLARHRLAEIGHRRDS